MHACDPAPGWFRDHFNEDYRTIYLGRGPEDADREVELVMEELEVISSDLVLDLCCGYGRHMLGFERRGVRAVGVDLSRPLLRQGACEIGGRPLLVCADMRDLPFEGGARGFSVVVNFFTSFGYFESDEQNLQVAREIRRVLRPGGRFAIDLMNADSTIRDLEPRSERVAGPYHVVEERTYDAVRKRIEKRIELRETAAPTHVRPCAPRRYFESVRVFSEGEIRALLAAASLTVDRILGDFGGGAYGPDSPRMIVLGRSRD